MGILCWELRTTSVCFTYRLQHDDWLIILHHLNESLGKDRSPSLSIHFCSSSSSSSLWLSVSLLLSSLVLASPSRCFSFLSLTSYLWASHSPSLPLQWRHPPFVCSEALSTPQRLEVNCHEQTTTPQRVFKPVISCCEFAFVCICSSGSNLKASVSILQLSILLNVLLLFIFIKQVRNLQALLNC